MEIEVTQAEIEELRLRLLKNGQGAFTELVRREKQIKHLLNLYPAFKRYFIEGMEPHGNICQHGLPFADYCEKCGA